jgi:hypothetical protein
MLLPIPLSRAHGKPFCSGTRAGACNSAFQEFLDDTQNLQRWIYVYNRNCDQIGGSGGEYLHDFELDSQLPYVLVGNFDNYQFRYAGQCYGWHISICFAYAADDAGTNNVYQCAFNGDYNIC